MANISNPDHKQNPDLIPFLIPNSDRKPNLHLRPNPEMRPKYKLIPNLTPNPECFKSSKTNQFREFPIKVKEADCFTIYSIGNACRRIVIIKIFQS